jgi:EmrB/QacA subfamily drug resistance transporter
MENDRPSRVILTLIVGCAFFMQNLDTTIVATALPQIGLTFGVQPVNLSMIIIAYLLGQCAFMPVSAWAADRFGANTVFCCAIVLFTIASILCGISQEVWQLAAARLLQGIGASMMMPVGRLLLLRSIDRSEFVRASTYLALLGQLGPILGPPLGGLFATYATWRWIFLINVPFGIIGVVLALKYVTNFRAEERRRFDLVGFVIIGTALSSLMYGLDSIGHSGIGIGMAVVLACMGVVLLVFSAWRSKRVTHPLLDFSLFSRASFRLNFTGGLLFRLTGATADFLLPILFQVGFGMTPFKSGLLILVLAAAAMAMRQTINMLLLRMPFRTLLIATNSILAVVLPLYALLGPDTSLWIVLALLIMTGAMQSLSFIALNSLTYSNIAPDRMSSATSLGQLGNQAGGSLGVALTAAILQTGLGLRGGSTIQAADFGPAFIFVGLAALGAVLIFLRIPPEMGAELRGQTKDGSPPAKS